MENTYTYLLDRQSEIKSKIKALQQDLRAVDAAILAVRPMFSEDNCSPGKKTRRTFGGVTIKDMVREALETSYPNGADANQILGYINQKWDKGLVRSSLSPQLSRLKKEEVIDLQGGLWILSGDISQDADKKRFLDEKNGEPDMS